MRTKYLLTTAVGLGLVGLSSCTETPNTQVGNTDVLATSDVTENAAIDFTGYIISRDRANIGTIKIIETPDGIDALITAEGLPPGLHGMHFHKVGDCSDEEFKQSDGHINPMNKQHGLDNPDGPDNADLPNLLVQSDGSVTQNVRNNRLSLNGADGLPALLDADGSALVIHANPDDQISQPIGGAGSRIACAVIKAL